MEGIAVFREARTEIFHASHRARNRSFAPHTEEEFDASTSHSILRGDINHSDPAPGGYGNCRISIFGTAERELH